VIRGFLGLFPDEYEGVQFVADTWDRADKGIQLYKQYQDFKQVKGIVKGAKAGGELLEATKNPWRQAVKEGGFALSKLGKFVAWADIAISGTETVMHTVKAINSTGQDRTDAIFDALGSGGDVLFAAGTLVGPTPLGMGLMATGAVLGAISWGYKHRGTIKKAWNGVKNGVKSAAKWIGNKVKGWFS